MRSNDEAKRLIVVRGGGKSHLVRAVQGPLIKDGAPSIYFTACKRKLKSDEVRKVNEVTCTRCARKREKKTTRGKR